MNEYEIIQGNTGPILRSTPYIGDQAQVIDANWRCETLVMDRTGNAVVPKREITDTDAAKSYWPVALLPTETASLTLTKNKFTEFIWVIQIYNDTTVPPFRIERQFLLKVKKQGLV